MIQALVKTATPFHWYHRLRRLVNTLLRLVCEPQTSRLRSLTGIAISKPRQILSSRACRGRDCHPVLVTGHPVLITNLYNGKLEGSNINPGPIVVDNVIFLK